MKDLMSSNVYQGEDNMVIMGTCLPYMQPLAYEKLKTEYKNVFNLCLEKDHINMAISKLAGMVARKNIKNIIFVTVNKSPHCIQLHYIAKELAKITKSEKVNMKHFVAVDNELIEIDSKVIDVSKDLIKLSKLLENQ